MVVSWESPAYNGSSALVSFIVYVYESESSDWDQRLVMPASARHVLVDDLLADTPYYAVVHAVNDEGAGEASVASAFVSTLPMPLNCSMLVTWYPGESGMWDNVSSWSAMTQRYVASSTGLPNEWSHVAMTSGYYDVTISGGGGSGGGLMMMNGNRSGSTIVDVSSVTMLGGRLVVEDGSGVIVGLVS